MFVLILVYEKRKSVIILWYQLDVKVVINLLGKPCHRNRLGKTKINGNIH